MHDLWSQHFDLFAASSSGDVTYVLERPTARGFRLAVGTAWLATHRTRPEKRLAG